MQAFPNPALNLDGGGKAPALPLGGMGIPLILFGVLLGEPDCLSDQASDGVLP